MELYYSAYSSSKHTVRARGESMQQELEAMDRDESNVADGWGGASKTAMRGRLTFGTIGATSGCLHGRDSVTRNNASSRPSGLIL